jgi:hypothetical protein
MSATTESGGADLELTYALVGSGWAAATLRIGDALIEMTASYLHDTLRELAEATLRLADGAPEATVTFMDEPGEHHLVLEQRAGGELYIAVRWFADWASWGMHPSDRFETVLAARTTVRRLRHQVLNVLWRLLEEHGVDRYKAQWVQHDFPLDAYERLQAA